VHEFGHIRKPKLHTLDGHFYGNVLLDSTVAARHAFPSVLNVCARPGCRHSPVTAHAPSGSNKCLHP
jgi:hypothetical protein